MFGGKKDLAPPVGAKEKQLRAQLFKGGGRGEQIRPGRGGGQKQTSPAMVVFAIWLLSTGLAWFLTEGPWKSGLGFRTGLGFLDNFIFSSGAQNIIGDPAVDNLIIVILRGFMIFLAAGFLPGAAFVWSRLLDRPEMNPYRTVWGMSVGIGFFFFLLKDAILPVLGELFGMA